jgi:hypothetical protein
MQRPDILYVSHVDGQLFEANQRVNEKKLNFSEKNYSFQN